MNHGSLYSLYWKTLTEYCRYCNVPEEVIPEITDELHQNFKALFEVDSISQGRITKRDLWEFVQKVQMMLAREFGFSLDMNEELKFN